MRRCVWCEYSYPEEQIEFIFDEDTCVCTECFREWADHEIADLQFKVDKAKDAITKIQFEMMDECGDSWKLKHISEIVEELEKVL